VNPFEIISARWNGGPLEFLIAAGMPFVFLIPVAVIFFVRGTRFPAAFYAAAVLSSVLGLLYAPVCGCMGFQQILGASGIAFLISALVFLPFLIRYAFSKATAPHK
jgi:ABC-type uncharacterized transport system permease subunit